MADHVNAATVELIKRNEGCVLHAYPDPATGGDPWTIGYGHTGPDVYPGLTITQEQAEVLLRADLVKFEQHVASRLRVPATPNQFGAMVSLAYNIGPRNFDKSSVLRYHNEGNYVRAALAFDLWNKANGRVMKGLTRRRGEERDLYQAPEPDADVIADVVVPFNPVSHIRAAQRLLGTDPDGDPGPETRKLAAQWRLDHPEAR